MDRVDVVGGHLMVAFNGLVRLKNVVLVVALVMSEVTHLGRLCCCGEQVGDAGQEVEDRGVVSSAFCAPRERSAGLVVVPGEDAGAAVPGEDRRQEDRRARFGGAALWVGDRDSSRSWPVLLHGTGVVAPFLFGGPRCEAEAEPCQRLMKTDPLLPIES